MTEASVQSSMKLIIEDDEGRRSVVPIDLGEATVGRDEANTIRLNERNVSRHHARIVRENGSIVAEDLDSYNGVYINGDRVKQRQDLHEGDVLRVGDFQLEIRGEGMTRRTEETTQKAGPRDEEETTKPSIRLDDSAPDDGAFRDPSEYDDQDEGRHEPTAIIRVGQMEELEAGSNAHAIAGAKARLVCVSTQFAGTEFEIDREESVIGRTDDNDIAVDHRSVSRHHAKIMVTGRSYRIIDMKSANGTLVNGEEYAQIELKSGDLIELGHVKFRFVPPGGAYSPTSEESAAMARSGNPAKRQTMASSAPLLPDPSPAPEYVPSRDSGNHAIPRSYPAPEPRRSNTVLYLGIGLVVLLLGAVLAVLLTRTGEDRVPTKLVEVGPGEETPKDNAGDERVQSLLDRMTEAVVDENWDSAKQLAETVLLLESENAQAAKVLERSNREIAARDAFESAETMFESGNRDGALKALEKVPAGSSMSRDASSLRAKIESAGESTRLEEAISKALDEKKYEVAQKLAKDLAAYDSNRAEELIAEIKESQATGRRAPKPPRPRPPVNVNKPNNGATPQVAKPDAPPATQGKDGKKPDEYLKEAVKLIQANQPEKALKPLQECVRANARYCRCYRALGIAHARMKNNAKAARNYKTFIQLCPNDPEAPRIREFLGE